MSEPTPLQTLFDTLPQSGSVEWIGIRPARGEAMKALNNVMISRGTGLEGDRFKGRETSKRQVTLIQKEHLYVIAACLHREAISPDVFRRNIVVSGLNLSNGLLLELLFATLHSGQSELYFLSLT